MNEQQQRYLDLIVKRAEAILLGTPGYQRKTTAKAERFRKRLSEDEALKVEKFLADKLMKFFPKAA